MPTMSLAKSLPSELLELVFFWLVESDREQARLAYDRSEQEYREKWEAPATRDAPRLSDIGRVFAGDSHGLRSAALVCRNWHPYVR